MTTVRQHHETMPIDRARETIFCAVNHDHKTNQCILIVANENAFDVVDVTIGVELGSPLSVEDRRTIRVGMIPRKRSHVERIELKRPLGPIPIVEARIMSASRA